MTFEERQRKIESYGSAYQTLVEGLQHFPREMWQFRPAPDRWTIHEIVIHITDSEANSYIRCRRFIAEPDSTVLGYDEMKWARDLHYHKQSINDELKLFKWLRHKSSTLIRDLPESVWTNTVTHTQDGLIQMDDWLDTYERHIPEHITQMQANLEDWMKQREQVSKASSSVILHHPSRRKYTDSENQVRFATRVASIQCVLKSIRTWVRIDFQKPCSIPFIHYPYKGIAE